MKIQTTLSLASIRALTTSGMLNGDKRRPTGCPPLAPGTSKDKTPAGLENLLGQLWADCEPARHIPHGQPVLAHIAYVLWDAAKGAMRLRRGAHVSS
jgi:hypothetical protein